jgi:hypothetical protein
MVTGQGRTLAGSKTDAAEIRAWLLRSVADAESAARFGSAYLALRPSERDAAGLAAAIRHTISVSGAAAGTDGPAERFSLVDAVVRAEYAHGEVEIVDGWLLSRTEARLYALVTLAFD